MSLYKKIIKKLISKKLTLSTAESCTGGLLSYSFIKNKNASMIFDSGFITYSNKSKIENLKVRKSTILKFGSVSPNVAKQMTNGLFKKNKSNICIATTGIAGPGGAIKNKPIGLIYIGIRINKKNH